MRRFYIPPGQMGKNEAVISGSDAHHLRDVLRLKPDELIIAFDGTGTEYRARVVSISRERVRVKMLESVATQVESTLNLTVALGYLKDKKMDGVVRQLTELGVSRWFPFLCRRSVPQPDRSKLESRFRRWQKISLESLKQCGRNRAMAIGPVMSFDEALAQAASFDAKIVFWEDQRGTTPLSQALPAKPDSVFLLVGPEGGFEAHEIEQARDAGFVAAGMGPRILKADTAALAAAVLAQHICGDMGR